MKTYMVSLLTHKALYPHSKIQVVFFFLTSFLFIENTILKITGILASGSLVAVYMFFYQNHVSTSLTSGLNMSSIGKILNPIEMII